LFRSFNKLMGRVQEAEEKNLRYVAKLENAYQDLSTAQEQLIASEKLASLGRLSAGIAHEIGNPLSALSGYLSLAQKLSPAEDGESKEFIARALREAERIDRIIRGLLDFARPRKEGQAAAKPVAQLLDEVSETLRAQAMFQKIHWVLDYRSVDGVVETASGRLEQVLFNLCINAADAMAGEGTLTLQAEQTSGRIRICVADTGVGIQPEDMPNLFEPFFTTKPSDRGTGLGLAISHQIVSALGGKIWCESAPGEGARFWVELPALPAPKL
jgi:signal transduction histidine kinase